MIERILRKRGQKAPRWRRAALLAVGSLAAVGLVGVSPAQAAAPSNDTPAGAPLVTSTPYRVTEDTTQATEDATNPPGAATNNDHSVFFHYRLHAAGKVIISTKGSDYAHVLRLYHADSATAAPDTWTLVARKASDANAAALMRANTADGNYFVMVSSPDGDPGGMLAMNIRRPTGLGFSLAANGFAHGVDGSAILHGTLKATHRAQVRIYVQLRQRVGDHIVQGSASTMVPVSRQASTWHLRVQGDRPFRAGQVRVSANQLWVIEPEGFTSSTHHFARRIVTLTAS